MSLQVAKRPRAIKDLLGHHAYLHAESPDAAERFIEAAEKTFGALASMPGVGERWKTRNPQWAGVRVWPVRGFRKYLVFYRFDEDQIEILHILHGSRDISSLLEEELDE